MNVFSFYIYLIKAVAEIFLLKCCLFVSWITIYIYIYIHTHTHIYAHIYAYKILILKMSEKG